MATVFPYKVQASGRGLVERFYTGAEMMSGMDVIHKNPDDKGLWILDSLTGYLRINSNQNGLSARYFKRDLNKRDYTIRTEVIPSGADDDNFGIMFRYQDPFHFYFIGWDGGGEYNWGMQTLRLYKVQGEEYKLLASYNAGPWRGGNTYKLDVDAYGNEFVVQANGVEVIRVTDNDNPYLTGAFGPCATSQVAAWKSFFIKGDFDFMVEKEFQGEIDQTNFDYATAKQQGGKTVGDLMKDTVRAYLLSEGYVENDTKINEYSLSTSYLGVELYFNTTPVSKKTTSTLANIHAYMLYATTPPVTPTNFAGKPQGQYIVWTWDDATPFEDGFEILDENGRLLATLGENTTQWTEGPLDPETMYTRKLRSYNLSGKSATLEASAKTEALPPDGTEDTDDTIIYAPAMPINLRGMVQSPSAITWYWDKVEGADYYELWDAETDTLIGRETVPRFKETGLLADTLYKRYVTATNIAGKSSPSNVAMAFTDAVPPELDVPPTPINFHGETIDQQSIVWRWQAPEVNVLLTNPDGTERSPEEIEAEREQVLSTFNYRVYDMNGEVLYEAPPGVFEWVEEGLMPNTAYTHFVKIFVQMAGSFVESQRSNYGYATTFVTEDNIGEEDQEVLPWPLSPEELICKPHETEPKERIEAFHTGIGDNLDLKVRPAGQKPKYKTGTMRRDIPEDLDGDGFPDYGPDGTGDKGPGGTGGGGGWPLGPDYDGGTGGGIGNHGDWEGWGPGHPQGGGHGPIGHGGYDTFNPEYGIGGPGNQNGGGPIKGQRPGNAIGYPGYMEGSEIGVCTVDSPRESFKYDIQIQGTEFVDIDVYEEDKFEFRFKGEGFETTRDYVNDYLGKFYAYPRTPMDFKITAEVEQEPVKFQSYYEVVADVEELVDSNVQFSTVPYADVTYTQMDYVPTTEEIFNGPGANRWGPNEWWYSVAEDSVVTNQNLAWSGFYSNAFLDVRDYVVECEMGVIYDSGSDDDFMGFAFRLQENTDGTRRFYFFGADAGGSGLGGQWGLYKVHKSPNYKDGINITNIKKYSNLLQSAKGMTNNWVPGQYYKVRIEAHGPRIVVFVDDVEVINFYDDDPNFDRGSWGPTTASQEGVAYRRFVFNEGARERVYGDAFYNTIDVMEHTTSSKAIVVTDQLIADLIMPDVLAAHSRFINTTKHYSSVLAIRGYGAEASKPYLKTIADEVLGQSGIKVYATGYDPNDLLYKTTEVIIEEPRFTKSVDPIYNSPSSTFIYDTFPPELAVSIAAKETYDLTRKIYTGFGRVNKFINDNNMLDTQLTIKDVIPVSLNPDVAVFATLDLQMKAYIKNMPIYFAEKRFNTLSDYHTFTDEWIPTDIDVRLIVPKDQNGVAYAGDVNNIIYKVVYDSTLYDVAFSDKGAKTFYKIAENEQITVPMSTINHIYSVEYPAVRYRIKHEKVHNFSGTTPGPLATYYSFAELVPESVNYPDAIYKIGLTSSEGEVWMALASNEMDRRRANEELLVTENEGELILVGTEGAKIYRPWTGYSRWFGGSVNGVKPFYQDQDGKKDMYVPIDMDVPINIEMNAWYVETRGSNTIRFDILNGVGNRTEFPNDTVHFYSDHLTTKSIGRKWFGPKYTVEYDINLCGTKEEEFEGQVPAPGNDPGLGNLVGKPEYSPPPGEVPDIVIGHFSIDEETGEYIEEEPIFAAMETLKGVKWETIVTSRNPNVAIKVTSPPNYSAEGGVFLPVKVKAWIINPIQVPWNPLVHNGYYYLNQKEYFLYANSKITGKFVETQGPQSIDVPYSVKVYCERLAFGAMKTWEDTYRSDFKGVASLIDLDTSLGQMSLRTNTDGVYYASGTYTSDNKPLSAEPEYWDAVNWDAITPGTSSIKVETSSMDTVTGTWSGWQEVANGGIIPSPLSDTLRYRITMNAGQEEVITNKDTNYETETEWKKGIMTGVNASRNGIEMDNPANGPIGTWRSNVIDLGANINTLGTLTWAENLGTSIGTSVLVETMTADTAAGPWDGTAQPWKPLLNIVTNPDGTKTGTIDSLRKRYLIIRYTLTRGHVLVSDYRVEIKDAKKFVDGNVDDNAQVVDNSVVLIDPTQTGAYITPPMAFGSAVALKQVLLNSTIPSGAKLVISTLSAPTIADFATLELDPLNWKALGTSNKIMSPVNSFMKVKIEMTPGTGPSAQKDVTIQDGAAWTANIQTLSNARITGNAIEMIDPEFLSYAESKPFDFVEVQSWLSLLSTFEVNDGAVKLYTSTSNSPFTGWEAWKPVTATNIIQSTVNRYIRFRVEFTAVYTVADGTKVLPLTGTFENLQVSLTGNGLTQIDPSENGFFVSDTIVFDRVSAYRTIAAIKTLKTDATATISTRSSLDGVTWTNWEAISETSDVYTPAYPFFQYRVAMTPGVNATAVKKIMEDTGAAANTETVYNSGVIDFGGKVSAFDTATLTVTMPEQGGSIKLYTITGENKTLLEEDASTLVWTEATFNGTAYTIASPAGRYIRYRLELTAGTTAGASKLPVVSRIAIATTATGFQTYEPSTVEDISIAYGYKNFVSPRLLHTTVSAMCAQKLTPKIHGITAIADIYNWYSPKVTSAKIVSKVRNMKPCTPTLYSIGFSAKMKDRVTTEEYTVSLTGNLTADTHKYQLSDLTMKEIIDNHFKETNVSETNLTRKQYEVFSNIAGIVFSVQNDNQAHYADGLSPVFARTGSTTIGTQYTQTKFLVDNNNQVLVSPIPQQGAPIVIRDSSGQEMKHVNFYDEDDRLTLWYKSCYPTDGTRKFLVDHPDFDPDTIEIEVDEDPSKPYTKLIKGDDYVFCNNVITFRKLYPEGTVIWYKYILKNSFIVDYNYDVTQSNALVTLHKPVLNDHREVEIAYETDVTTAYYKATEIDLNPMRNALNEGFIYLTDEYHPAVKLDIRFNPNMLHANGQDQTTIQVVATDRFGNPVVGDNITISASDGKIEMKSKTTDINGIVTALYTASKNPGEVVITAEDKTSHLEVRDTIYLRGIHPQPRAEIVLSAQEILPDGMDKVKITARIVDHEQQRAVQTNVLFEAPKGTSLDFKEDMTNYEGEAHTYIRIINVPKDNIVTIKVTAPEFGAVGYANLLIKEVARFV